MLIKLQHSIESYIMKTEEVKPDLLESFINEHDKIYDELVFGFPSHIKMKVIKKYQGKKALPNSLSFLASVDIVITNEGQT